MKNIRWKLSVISIVVLLSFCMFGCEKTEPNNGGGDSQATGEVEVAEDGVVAASEEDGEGWMTLTEMLDSPAGSFIERDSMFYRIDDASWGEIDPGDARTEWQYRGDDEAQVVVFQTGDRIATTKYKSSCFFFPVIEEGYSCGSDQNKLRFYDEINSQEVENDKTANAALSTVGIWMNEEYTNVAASPITVVCGRYEGTKWVEEEVSFDIPYCLAEGKYGSYAEADITQTKDGYFYYEFSDLPAGKYMLSFPNVAANYGGCMVSLEW